MRVASKHETPNRVGGVLGGGVGLATGLVVALFPFAGIGADTDEIERDARSAGGDQPAAG